MYKWVLILVFVALSGSFRTQVAGQTTGTPNQTLNNVKGPKDPLRAATDGLATPSEPTTEAVRAYTQGLKLLEDSQLPEAEQKFQQAIKLDREYADAYSALGRTYFKMRQWQK